MANPRRRGTLVEAELDEIQMEVAVCSGTLRQQQQPEVLAGERVGPRTDAGSSRGGTAMGMERQGDEDEARRGSKAEGGAEAWRGSCWSDGWAPVSPPWTGTRKPRPRAHVQGSTGSGGAGYAPGGEAEQWAAPRAIRRWDLGASKAAVVGEVSRAGRGRARRGAARGGREEWGSGCKGKMGVGHERERSREGGGRARRMQK